MIDNACLKFQRVDGGYIISWYNPIDDSFDDGYLEIPSTHRGKPVIGIADSAFSYSDLKSVTIPDSVTSIGDAAFSNCRSLTSITIPDSVTSIGNWTFYECTSLKSITIPGSVTSIGDYAFRGCTSLNSVTIPDSVTSIGSYAFDECA